MTVNPFHKLTRAIGNPQRIDSNSKVSKMFYDAGCVTRHFDAHHSHGDPLKRDYCEVSLVHKVAFQRHASDIHRVENRCREPRDA